MSQQRFREGRLTTAYIAEEFPDGFLGVLPTDAEARELAAVAASINQSTQRRNARISGSLANHQSPVGTEWVVTLGSFTLPLHVKETDAQMVVKFDDGEELAVSSDWTPGRTHALFAVNGTTIGV
jgi:propionyl-CoA carboxylase alpha chain